MSLGSVRQTTVNSVIYEVSNVTRRRLKLRTQSVHERFKPGLILGEI